MYLKNIHTPFITFDYNDINLVPEKCIVESRRECKTTQKLGKFEFNLPVVPANMSSVINKELAIKLATYNYFYIMHRFNVNNYEFVKDMNKRSLISSISVGINNSDIQLINKLSDDNIIPDYITIDIAHGHSIHVANMIKLIKEKLPTTYIIAGNVSTISGAEFLYNNGANCVKVGIGPGNACTTYMNTGFGSRYLQASVVYNIAKAFPNNDLIADGNINEIGDICKSIALGAKFIMCGKLLTGFEDSPNYNKNSKTYTYYGSASNTQKLQTSSISTNIEGTAINVPIKNMSLINYLQTTLTESLQSAISYSGGNSLNNLKNVNIIVRNQNKMY